MLRYFATEAPTGGKVYGLSAGFEKRAAALLNAMPEQLSLWRSDAASRPFIVDLIDDPRGKLFGYTLFMAIFPQPEDAQLIVASNLGAQHGLSGERLKLERLHMTLLAIAFYGKNQAIPQSDVDAAKAAAASVVCPALHIKVVASPAAPPSALASGRIVRPISMLRRGPRPSANAPKATPAVMPAACTMESRKPACIKLSPSAACSAVIAGGSLPTCKAAQTPARMATSAGSMRALTGAAGGSICN